MNILEQSKNEEFVKEQFIKGRILDDTKDYGRTQFVDEIYKLKQENQQLKDLIDTILNFSFFKEECPLNFGFEDNSKEDETQNIFYSGEYCENNCNDIYKDCWLKYFKELQELKQESDRNVKN